jgi:hypothetical protein
LKKRKEEKKQAIQTKDVIIILRLSWNTVFHKSPTPVPILSQINPIHTLQSYFPKLHFSLKFQISCPFSVAWAVPKYSHKSEALCNISQHAAFFTVGNFYSSRPTSKLVDHPLLTHRDCLYNNNNNNNYSHNKITIIRNLVL